MNAGELYVVDGWGGPLGHGTAADPHWCQLAGIAKTNSDGAPYAVANEFICGRLAFMIGLPVPPGILVKTDLGEPAYVCLRFGRAGETPPPANAEELVEDNPRIAAGVVAFDAWVGNTDRHRGNIAYSRGLLPLTIFDHSHALLGPIKGGGVTMVKHRAEQPCTGYGCLDKFVKVATDLSFWAERIRSFPDDIVADVCNAVQQVAAATPDEIDAALQFLLNRKKKLYELMKSKPEHLPGVVW